MFILKLNRSWNRREDGRYEENIDKSILEYLSSDKIISSKYPTPPVPNFGTGITKRVQFFRNQQSDVDDEFSIARREAKALGRRKQAYRLWRQPWMAHWHPHLNELYGNPDFVCDYHQNREDKQFGMFTWPTVSSYARVPTPTPPPMLLLKNVAEHEAEITPTALVTIGNRNFVPDLEWKREDKQLSKFSLANSRTKYSHVKPLLMLEDGAEKKENKKSLATVYHKKPRRNDRKL